MFQRVLLGIGLAVATGTQAWAASKCNDIPTVWTLNSTFVDGITATRIYSDGGPYVDGSQSVTAVIRCNTDDAVLMLGSRQVMFNFAGAFLGTSYSQPPAWTNGPAFASPPSGIHNCGGSPCTVLNIRNILNNGSAPRNQYYILYTRLFSGLGAPDLQKYYLRMENPATSDVAPTPNDSTANSPYLNARVVVEHYPASGGQKEYWLIYPETPASAGSQSLSPENSVLLGTDGTNYGQFSVPFFFRIEAQ